MNSRYRFPDDKPPDDLLIYWDEKGKCWCIWFPEPECGIAPPWIADGDYNPFVYETFHFKRVKSQTETRRRSIRLMKSVGEKPTKKGKKKP